ncbi:outer membrane protein assembly factor BamB family protein [Mariniluteicoccus flavus]
MRGWLAAIIAVVVMAWIGVMGIALSAPPSPAKDGVARFVAGDGRLERVALGPEGEPASVDSGRVRGAAALLAAPRAAVKAARPPEDADPKNTEFWRESVRPALAADAPAAGPSAAAPAGEFRLHALTPSGVHLILALGGIEGGGVAFDRGLLELPPDVAPGRSWTSSARGRMGERVVEVTNRSLATVPTDPALRDRGCLDVHGETTIGGVPREERATWCPGRGVVSGTPMLGSLRTPWSGPWPPPPLGGAERRSLPDAPRVVRPAHLNGDPLMGWQPDDPSPEATPGVALPDGTVVTADILASSLTGWQPGDGPNGRPALFSRWWVQPGGAIAHLDVVGDTVVATTGTKRLAAYDASGRRLWTATLKDLAPGGVTALGHDAVVVATMSGEVAAYSLVDGAKRWATSIQGGGTTAPVVAGGRVLVMTSDDGVVALDAASGTKVFDQKDASGAVAIAPDGAVVTMHLGGEMLRLDPVSGEVRALGLAAVGRRTSRLLSAHGYLAAYGGGALTLIDPTTLAEVAHLDGALDVAADDRGWVVATRTHVVSLAANGDERLRVALDAPIDEARIQFTRDGVTLVSSAPKGAANRQDTAGEVLWIR